MNGLCIHALGFMVELLNSNIQMQPCILYPRISMHYGMKQHYNPKIVIITLPCRRVNVVAEWLILTHLLCSWLSTLYKPNQTLWIYTLPLLSQVLGTQYSCGLQTYAWVNLYKLTDCPLQLHYCPTIKIMVHAYILPTLLTIPPL